MARQRQEYAEQVCCQAKTRNQHPVHQQRGATLYRLARLSGPRGIHRVPRYPPIRSPGPDPHFSRPTSRLRLALHLGAPLGYAESSARGFPATKASRLVRSIALNGGGIVKRVRRQLRTEPVNKPLGIGAPKFGVSEFFQDKEGAVTANAAAAGGRIIELDGIRGCACLLVVVGHYFGEVAHGARFLCLEWIGVDLFFCLSGFLIGGILLDNRVSPSYFATFYTRRGFRIFPIYYVTIILVLLALPRFPGLTESNYPASMYFGYTQNFVLSFTGIEVPQWLMPTWTLCVEE